MQVQEIIVFSLFGLALLYFGYRLYAKNLKKKGANDKGCTEGNCGCS
jgi:hypothetical protein